MSFSVKNNDRKIESLESISRILSIWVLYVPLGLLSPIVKGVDKINYYLKLKNLTQRYHHISNVPEQSMYYAPLLMQTYGRVMHAIAHIVYALLYPAFFVFSKILPLQSFNIFPEKVNAYLKKCYQAWFESKILWLKSNPSKVTYFYLLPTVLAAGFSAMFGVTILIEIYLFWACSFWSGLMVNTLANIVTQGWNASVVKDSQKLIYSMGEGLSEQDKIRYKKFWQKTSLYLAFDLAFFRYIHRLREWATGCFASFQEWTMLYVAVKLAANNSPALILRLESYLEQDDSLQKQEIEKRPPILGNGLWLIGYHFLHELGSQDAINDYHQNQTASDSKNLGVIRQESPLKSRILVA